MVKHGGHSGPLSSPALVTVIWRARRRPRRENVWHQRLLGHSLCGQLAYCAFDEKASTVVRAMLVWVRISSVRRSNLVFPTPMKKALVTLFFFVFASAVTVADAVVAGFW